MTDRLSCSAGSLAAGEELAGTAPHSVAWVALEQNGPWGAKALTDSHLDAELGRAVEEAAAAHRTRPSLIRRPGRHPDHVVPARPHADPRHLLVAFTRPSGSWLLEGIVERPDVLMDLDWAALESGDAAAVRRSLPSLVHTDRNHLLVCTNGRRDVCCASFGRPVALGAAHRHPNHVWEVTHTSGHRFAPTTVLLPSGTLHGRLDVAAAVHVLEEGERGHTVLAGSRGRSCWPGPAQVAELHLRELLGETALDALEVTDHADLPAAAGSPVLLGGWTTTVTHRDGRRWRVQTEARASHAQRSESCGKALKPLSYYVSSVTDPATAG